MDSPRLARPPTRRALGEIRLGKKAPRSWDDAALDWWSTHGQTTKSAEDDRLRLAKLTTKLSGITLEAITQAVLAKAIPTKSAARRLPSGGLKPGRVLSPATRNRYLALASAILHHAQDRGWLTKAPKMNYAEEVGERFPFLSQAEARASLAELPEHLAAMARFSLATGLRRRNVTHPQWSQVDLVRGCAWIWGDEANAGRAAITAPLNEDAVAVLKGQVGRHARWRFVWRGKPFTRTKTKPWDRAVAKIGRTGAHLARTAAHVGLVACDEGHAPERAASLGRLELAGDGPVLRPPDARPFGRVRRAGRVGYKFGDR